MNKSTRQGESPVDSLEKIAFIPSMISSYDPQEFSPTIVSHFKACSKTVKEKLVLGLKPSPQSIALAQNEPISLILDLDETLVSFCSGPGQGRGLEFRRLNGVEGGSVWIGFASNLPFFLEEMNKLFRLRVCSLGGESYVRAIINFLDPNHTYFKEEDISFRLTNKHAKNVSIFGLDPQLDDFLILDDTASFWENWEGVGPAFLHSQIFIANPSDDASCKAEAYSFTPDRLDISNKPSTPLSTPHRRFFLSESLSPDPNIRLEKLAFLLKSLHKAVMARRALHPNYFPMRSIALEVTYRRNSILKSLQLTILTESLSLRENVTYMISEMGGNVVNAFDFSYILVDTQELEKFLPILEKNMISSVYKLEALFQAFFYLEPVNFNDFHIPLVITR